MTARTLRKAHRARPQQKVVCFTGQGKDEPGLEKVRCGGQYTSHLGKCKSREHSATMPFGSQSLECTRLGSAFDRRLHLLSSISSDTRVLVLDSTYVCRKRIGFPNGFCETSNQPRVHGRSRTSRWEASSKRKCGKYFACLISNCQSVTRERTILNATSSRNGWRRRRSRSKRKSTSLGQFIRQTVTLSCALLQSFGMRPLT